MLNFALSSIITQEPRPTSKHIQVNVNNGNVSIMGSEVHWNLFLYTEYLIPLQSVLK